MDGQRARLVSGLDRLPTIPARPAPARASRPPVPPGTGPRELLTTGWALVLGLGWPLVMVAATALEPAPADPNAPVPLVVELASLGLLAALVTAAVAAGMQHRAAALAGVAAGLVFLAFTVTCPVSGHHELGAWWFGQLALVAGMLAVSLAGLGHRSRAAG